MKRSRRGGWSEKLRLWQIVRWKSRCHSRINSIEGRALTGRYSKSLTCGGCRTILDNFSMAVWSIRYRWNVAEEPYDGMYCAGIRASPTKF